MFFLADCYVEYNYQIGFTLHLAFMLFGFIKLVLIWLNLICIK